MTSSITSVVTGLVTDILVAEGDTILGYCISINASDMLMAEIARGIIHLARREKVSLRIGLSFEVCTASDTS